MSRGGIFCGFLVLAIFASFVFPSLLFKSTSSVLQWTDKPGDGASIPTRRSLEAEQNTSQKMVTSNLPCFKPSMDDFPRDFMSQSERKHGGAMVHLFLAVYAFIALTNLCDNYVVPSVEKIIDKLHIHPEVGGATLLAISGSASELFTSCHRGFYNKERHWARNCGGVGGIQFSIQCSHVCSVCGFHPSSVAWPVLA